MTNNEATGSGPDEEFWDIVNEIGPLQSYASDWPVVGRDGQAVRVNALEAAAAQSELLRRAELVTQDVGNTSVEARTSIVAAVSECMQEGKHQLRAHTPVMVNGRGMVLVGEVSPLGVVKVSPAVVDGTNLFGTVIAPSYCGYPYAETGDIVDFVTANTSDAALKLEMRKGVALLLRDVAVCGPEGYGQLRGQFAIAVVPLAVEGLKLHLALPE
jgi:hypothetical protein